MNNSANILKQRVLEWLESPNYRALTTSELARHLNLPTPEKSQLRQVLKDLTSDGTIAVLRGDRHGRPGDKPDIGRGLLEMNWRGIATIRISEGASAVPADIAGIRRATVAADGLGVALHGDTVEFSVKRIVAPDWQRHRARGRNSGKPEKEIWEARILSIIAEGPRRVTGTLRYDRNIPELEVDDDKRWPAIVLLPDLTKRDRERARDGDKVLVAINFWTSPKRPPQGTLLEVIGPAGAPGVDVLCIIHQFGLPLAFPDPVLKEANAISETIDPNEIKNREDWRDRLVLTIDPFDAKDFDDAINIEKLTDGWRLAVHIADVSHYVRPDSALEEEARQRGNSTYLVDRVIPMLPERLSNGICSLRPDEDRLTRVAVMEFDQNAHMRKSYFASAVIRSARRYAYEEAFAILQQPRPTLKDPADQMIHETWELASRLRRNRFKNGSLDLDFPEVKMILDEHGRPVELRKIDNDISHQLIEECMLAANEAVASILRDSGHPAIYRVHDDPDPERLLEYRELALLHGYSVGDLTNRNEISKLLDAVQGDPAEHAIKVGLLKSLKRAVYDAEPRGHYGLAKANYTHFTSPIRRYADLVVHRILGNLSIHSPQLQCKTPNHKNMAAMADHISTTERTSAEAEIESRRMKELEYFQNLIDSNSDQTFTAVVWDVRRNGLFIELVDLQVRGLVQPEDFPDGEFWFDNQGMRWSCNRPKHRLYTIGTKIPVTITHVNWDRRLLDFTIVDEGDEKQSPGQSRQKPSKKSASPTGNRKQPAKSTQIPKSNTSNRPQRSRKTATKKKSSPQVRNDQANKPKKSRNRSRRRKPN